MRWLINQGARIVKDTFDCACESGNLVMMGYLREYHRLHEGDCPFSGEACAAAARHGHLEALKWLRSEGCPWDELVCRIVGKPNIMRWIDAQSSSP